ncbi:MAG TPA: antitoxin family protein [Gemmataceae bacterium]|jgi:predicted DNA-binding antitoxin AbrB/MazE fold protein|nr:antitoxin family protein [Gemmataceae bacterium]
MTTTIEAVYQGGVFKPTRPVDLPENQRVTLAVQPAPPDDVRTWLDALRETRARLQAEYGTFPDSTPGIAEDRMRDV